MNMYRLLRNTHLLSGLAASSLLLMYSLSAIQMANSKWFPMNPEVSTQSYRIEPSLHLRAAARRLMDQGLRGDLVQPDGARFRIVRPGTVHEVRYDPATGDAEVKTSRAGFWGMLNRIHHLRGLWHDYPLMNVWGALVAVISLLLFTLGATGVYLWFKLYMERAVGFAIVTLSLAWSLAAVWLIRAA
jgi:hypothetical protein